LLRWWRGDRGTRFKAGGFGWSGERERIESGRVFSVDDLHISDLR
jgi:hypothetical protein